ncbi:MAG: hypothetical protein ACRENS_01915 [Candidatus Eiseniibacteriota bacterium]
MTAARALLLGTALVMLTAASGSKDTRRPAGDLVFTHPQYAQLAPASIAMLPAASFDSNSERERVLAVTWAANFGSKGYRWMSATTSRAMLSSDSTGLALMAAARGAVLKQARLDSTIAQRMCRKLRVQAVLGVRLDGWDSQTIDTAESGKPWSRAYVRAALIDSTGRLLWSAEGSETVDGLEHTAVSNATGIESSSPHRDFATGEGAPPSPQEVFQRIAIRWAAVFPPHPAPADSTH